jgi:large subunit ribosomal protein L6
MKRLRRKVLEEKFYFIFGNMSRLGKKPIEIPENTEVTVGDDSILVKGPLGELFVDYTSRLVEIKVEDNMVILTPKKETIEANSLWGTYSSLIRNMVEGVNKEFELKLIIEGVGFKAELKDDTLVLNVGFSHPVEIKVPEGLKASVEKDTISISGIDKQKVGQFAADVRATKKPEPYKGKGIRYSDEIVRRKEGKKAI